MTLSRKIIVFKPTLQTTNKFYYFLIRVSEVRIYQMCKTLLQCKN
jgi:hypothetical protein